MKFVQLEYPDGTLHNVLVNMYCHSNDKDVDYIDYYDITEGKQMYTILKVVNNTIYKDSSISEYAYDELTKNKTNKNLSLLPNKIENYKVNQIDNKFELEFEVFETEEGHFIPLNIAKAFHLDLNNTKEINSIICVLVNENDIKNIEDLSNKNTISFKPNNIMLYKEEIKDTGENKSSSFDNKKVEVYKDKNNNNKLFLAKENCDKYKIGNKDSFKYVNNIECYEISLIELTQIKNPIVKTVYLQKEINDFKKNNILIEPPKEINNMLTEDITDKVENIIKIK